MSEITPRMLYPYPSDREQPFFTSYKAGELARDASHWAHSENHNLVFAGGGTWTWDAGAGVLSWTDDVLILGFTTKQFMTIPAQSITVEDGEVVFFNVLRLLQTSTNVDLETAATIGKAGVRLHDLMLFATRIGDVVYFPGFNSMVDGDVGVLYGGGIPSGGGGGASALAAVLAVGTSTGANDISLATGQKLTSAAELTIDAAPGSNNASVNGGDQATTGNGGNANLRGGDGGITSGDGGSATLTGGASTANTGGVVAIKGGASVGLIGGGVTIDSGVSGLGVSNPVHISLANADLTTISTSNAKTQELRLNTGSARKVTTMGSTNTNSTTNIDAGATGDLTFGARSGSVTLNQSGDTALSGFTATSIIGSLNELKSGGGGGGGWSVVTETTAARSAVDNEFILVNAATCVITLPAPAINTRVGIKVIIATVTDIQIRTSGAGITADGTDYSASGLPLSAQYEQINLISDGSNWFIY
jgi:hypothetical protein